MRGYWRAAMEVAGAALSGGGAGERLQGHLGLDQLEVATTATMVVAAAEEGRGYFGRRGGWENDETVREAAVREAIEEAGVRGDVMGFLGCYHFKSKSHQDEFSPEGLCKAAMFAMHVKEELNSWPEQSTRQRSWLTVPEAMEQCRHPWMRDALLKGFSRWHAGISIEGNENDLTNPTESTPTR
ncbi:Nudix hydrolase 16, mitochondrial [Ananas comosus]|uniref:Nudix hydrolase 16, mitochondrial n=1 Tax=Ananas comosus TaxID=4615 RepID=A0A199VEP2_ANACO|nr:Nudix hydrolase 16, mitochondrial [Ananas comosus]